MPKVMMNFHVEVEQYEYLKAKAKETKRSMASIIREMIDEYREGEPVNGE